MSFSDLLCKPFPFSADATSTGCITGKYIFPNIATFLEEMFRKKYVQKSYLCILPHNNLKTVFMEHAKYFKDYVV